MAKPICSLLAARPGSCDESLPITVLVPTNDCKNTYIYPAKTEELGHSFMIFTMNGYIIYGPELLYL